MLCLKGRGTLVVLVPGRCEETRSLLHSLRRRSVRRIHRRLIVLSSGIESHCVRRMTPGYCRPRTSPNPLTGALSAKSVVVVCLQGRRTLVVLVHGSTRGSTPFARFRPTPVESSQPVRRKLLLQSSDTCLVKTVGRHTAPYHEICQRNRTGKGVPEPSVDPGCSCSFTYARGHIGCPGSTKIRRSGRCTQADETRPSAVAEETPTSELLPCRHMQLCVNTGCRIWYDLSTYDDGLLFQYNTTG